MSTPHVIEAEVVDEEPTNVAALPARYEGALIKPAGSVADLWSRVAVEGECLVWTGVRNARGYGLLYVRGRYVRVHRIVAEAFYGPLGDRVVRHHCDNPPCLRPDHLAPGTQGQNMADMRERRGLVGFVGAQRPSGERHGRAKLSHAKAAEIRRLYASGGFTQYELADRFGVAQSQVWAVVTGRCWKEGA